MTPFDDGLRLLAFTRDALQPTNEKKKKIFYLLP